MDWLGILLCQELSMRIPANLRKQIQEYRKAGFTLVDLHPRAGSHWMAKFKEFSQPQIITVSATDWRAWKNNISMYRRLAAEEKSK